MLPIEVAKEVLNATMAAGPAGWNLHYKIDGSGSEGVTYKLDQGSLDNARQTNDAALHRAFGNQPAAAAAAKAESHVASAGNRYQALFDKRGLGHHLTAAGGMQHRPNYRAQMPSSATRAVYMPKTHAQRMVLRQHHTLSKLFNQIQTFVTKSTKPEDLSNETRMKLAEKALQNGVRNSPMVKAVMKNQPKPRKRQWALFVDPHLVPTGFVTD